MKVSAAKFRMHLIGSLIKLNRMSEVLMHGRFFENFCKIMENLFGNLQKTCKKLKQFQPGFFNCPFGHYMQICVQLSYLFCSQNST